MKILSQEEFKTKIASVKSLEDLLECAGMGQTDAMVERKANENINTSTNANWYDAYGVVNGIKDMSEKTGTLLSRLSEGFEGSDLPSSYPIPFDVTNYFMQGKAEWANEARPVNDNTPVTSDKSTLLQASLIIQFGVTDKMIKHSTDKQLFDKIVAKASKTAIRTIESMIINGDSETGATGNVNSDDQAPATTYATTGGANDHRLLLDHGIRELAINNSQTFDVGAFDSDDLNSIRKLLGSQYMGEVSDLLFLNEPETELVMETDDALKLRTNTVKPTIDGLSSVLTPFGVEMIPHPAVPKTEADGKISATPANNTKGQCVLVYKPAVRWGFGEDVAVEVERMAGYGFEITCTMEVGFVILDGTNTVAAGINITL